MTSLRELIAERIRATGPITFAEFMELALYHPELGYYSRSGRRSGRVGDFFTSVDVGPVFGELLARQFAEMWRVLQGQTATSKMPAPAIDLVEAGAGNGQLSADVLQSAAVEAPEFYAAVRLHLVERSPAARAEQRGMLGMHASKLASSSADLPESINGIVFANELLDALPVHAVVMRPEGLKEIFIDTQDGMLVSLESQLSTGEITEYFQTAAIRLAPGARAEVNLRSIEWVRDVGQRLQRGFLVVIDYGHESSVLHSESHAAGTLAAYQHHQVQMAAADPPPGDAGLAVAIGRSSPAETLRELLSEPGERDITADVDLTSIRRAAEGAGFVTLGMLDQTYFLLALAADDLSSADEDIGAAHPRNPSITSNLKRRLALKTLILPGGLGSTQKVMLFGRNVGAPALRGCAFGTRLT